MRWEPRQPHTPRPGDTRTRKGFLFLIKTCVNPKTGKEESRWLERAKWEESFEYIDESFFWISTFWIDDNQEEYYTNDSTKR